MGIIVENGGILTTVQDEGRFGYQAFGVSTSGAMDNHSFHIANILVGNDMGEGALEMTFIGPTLKFTSDNIVAVTGGDLTPMLDGNEFPMYRVSSGERRADAFLCRSKKWMPWIYCICRRPGRTACHGKQIHADEKPAGRHRGTETGKGRFHWIRKSEDNASEYGDA